MKFVPSVAVEIPAVVAEEKDCRHTNQQQQQRQTPSYAPPGRSRNRTANPWEGTNPWEGRGGL